MPDQAAANASRTFIELLSALDRKRGKGGQQVVRVEHVHVHPGGQAVVGNVKAGDTAVVPKPTRPPAVGQELDRNRQLFVAVKGLWAFAPTDEIEGMIAAQAMAAHHASMECSRRAMVPDQPFEAAQALRKVCSASSVL
jgi:hypothetical protein